MTNYWEPGTQYNYGDVVLYEGRRYKIVQPHRSQGDWTPPITPALWGRLQDQDPGYQNQSSYNPSYQQSHEQPQAYPQQGGRPEQKEESRFDEAKNWVGDHKTELGIGAAVAGVGAYALHKHNKEKEEQKHQKQQQSWVSDHKTELALGAAAVGAGAYAYHKHNEKEDEQKQQQSQFDQAKTWAGEHEQQLKIGAGVLAGGAALAGGVAYYKHHEKEKEEEERRRQQQLGYQQTQYPQQQQKPQFTDQAKTWYNEHEKEVKIGAGVAAGAALLAGGAAYYKHQQGEKEEEERRQQQGRPQQQQRPPSREEDKHWYEEHKTELGLGAAALAIGGGAYAYHKHNEKEKEQEYHPQRPQSSDQEKSWLSEHEKQLKIGAGAAVGAAALAGGAAYYKHQQKEKEEQRQYGQSDYKAEITHLEEKTNRLHLDDERKHQLKVAGGVVAGTAALGGAYALYKHHEHGEDQKVFAANRELWLQDAQQRTDRFWQHGPNGPATWVLTRGPSIPKGALEVSREHTWNLYVCRSFHEGGLQVGKASEAFPQGGVIGYGHQEIHVDTYEILLGNMNGLRWVPARGKLNPVSLGYTPVEGGRENDGTRLYVAQAEFEGVFHPGKASDKLDGAYIPWGGTEKNIKEYRVLCYNN